MPGSRSVRLLLPLLLALLAACSSAPTATTDFDPGFDFSGVRKVAILPLNRQVTGQTALSDIQAARMSESLSSELVRRGLDVVEDPANADVLLSWYLVTQERTDIRTYNSSVRYRNCWNCPSSTNVRVRQYTRGTLIVDMLDPARMQTVWRSVLEDRLRDQSDPERAAEVRSSAAEAAFAEFPPG